MFHDGNRYLRQSKTIVGNQCMKIKSTERPGVPRSKSSLSACLPRFKYSMEFEKRQNLVTKFTSVNCLELV